MATSVGSRSGQGHGAPTSSTVADRVRQTTDRVYAGYLFVQAVCGILLWVGIATVPAFRSGFELLTDHPDVTTAFAVPDLALIVVGSALGGWGVLRRSSWAVPVVCATAGCVLYPTVFLIGYVAMGGAGAGGLGVMFLVSAAMGWVTVQIYRSHRS